MTKATVVVLFYTKLSLLFFKVKLTQSSVDATIQRCMSNIKENKKNSLKMPLDHIKTSGCSLFYSSYDVKFQSMYILYLLREPQK